MMKAVFRKLATGVVLATAVASFSAGACSVHMADVAGLRAAHPASIGVSVATRRAIDEKRIRDIPRGNLKEKFAALEKIEARFHEFSELLEGPALAQPLVFSLYLTESNHWSRFRYSNGQWNVKLHQTPPEEPSVVMVLSDTALMNLLDRKLSVDSALELGVLHIAGKPQEISRLARILGQLLDEFIAESGRADQLSAG